MDVPSTMAISHRSTPHQNNQPSQHNRRRLRRRPTFWDVRTSPYLSAPDASVAASSDPSGPSALTPSSSTNIPLGAAPGAPPHSRHPSHSHSSDPASACIPGPNDVVRTPLPGETGPLAGINVPALLNLLRTPATSASKSQHHHHQQQFHNNHFASSFNPNNPMSSSAQQLKSNHTGGARPQIPASVQPPAIRSFANGRQQADANSQMSDGSMQSTRHARRLYVGNLPADTTEIQIGDFFNRALVASKGSESGDDPVISVYINLDKRFAFIETRTVREAAAGLCLDGVKFRNVSLRVRRPNDFIPHEIRAKPPDGFNPLVLGIVSTQVSDGPNKMFIGGIPYSLNEDQVKGLLQSFGELAAFNLIKEPTTGLSKGFAFFEYADNSVVDAACKVLHGMQVGDKVLTVRRATHSSTTGNSFHSGSGQSAPTAPQTAKPVVSGATHASGLAGSNGNTSLTPAKMSDLIFPSTRVVVLKGLVPDEKQLTNTEFYAQLVRDIESEAEKFGRVEQVLVPRPSDEESVAVSAGNAFVKFADTEIAESAQICFNGRKYDDRPIKAEFFDENHFDSKNLKA